MDISRFSQELPKYKIIFEGLSLLPFSLKLGIYYIPLDKKVGEIVGFLGKISAWIEIVYPHIYIAFRDGKWIIEFKETF